MSTALLEAPPELAAGELAHWSDEVVNDAHRLLALSMVQVYWTDDEPAPGWNAAHQVVTAEFERRNCVRPRGIR